MVRISVIVPVFNASRWIERCIQGLLSQDYDPGCYEIIMVDNNSTDDSASLIRRHGRIRLLQEPEQSSYAARNLGAHASSGELLAFTDADCVPDRNWLTVVEGTLRNRKTQVVLGTRGFPSRPRALRLMGAYEDARIAYILRNRRQSCYFAFTNNMAVRRSAFDQYGPFPAVARCGDTLFLRRLANGEGPEAAEWNPEMRINHLEVGGARDYLKKSFQYARARERTKHIGKSEVLSLHECIQLFHSVCTGRPAQDKMILALLLSTGRLTWTAGSLL